MKIIECYNFLYSFCKESMSCLTFIAKYHHHNTMMTMLPRLSVPVWNKSIQVTSVMFLHFTWVPPQFSQKNGSSWRSKLEHERWYYSWNIERNVKLNASVSVIRVFLTIILILIVDTVTNVQIISDNGAGANTSRNRSDLSEPEVSATTSAPENQFRSRLFYVIPSPPSITTPMNEIK